MKKPCLLTAIVIIFFSFAVSYMNVSAQIKPGTFTIAPHAGWYVFDNDQDISNAPVHGIGMGYNFGAHLGAEGVFDYVYSDYKPNDDDRKIYSYRLDGLYHFMPDGEYVPYVAAGFGAITLDRENNGSNTTGLFNYGAGLKTFITESLTVRGDIRHIIDLANSHNNFAYTIGLTYFFGAKEKKVPPPSAVITEKPVAVAAPVEVPEIPAAAPVPISAALPPQDSDKDGVYDEADKCPDTPLDVLVDDEGCPVTRQDTVSIELKVEFEFDKSKIKTIYNDHLKKVSNFLKQYPDTAAVIEGHTCSIGTEEYNLGLSRRRAEAVVKHLISSGIEPARLKVMAYGESRPIADNKTKVGRKRNRRVTAVISTIVINVIKR
ncbi:MAG: OmpA family protein [Nitrospirota bacterium]